MYYISIVFIFLISFNGTCQNLVLNPSFEEYYYLPDLKFEYDPRYEDSTFICKYWHRVRGTTPDYYHVNAQNERYKIPCGMLGCHNLINKKDSAFIGFGPLKLDGATELISGEFVKPLPSGVNFEISFMYCYAGSPCYFSLDKIEVYVSESIHQFQKYYFLPMYNDIITPEIKANVKFSEVLINDGEWHKITGYYSAKGWERYISFGIFYQDEKFYRIINEYLNGNFIIGQNPDKEERFFRKYKNLIIHKNPDYKLTLTSEQRLSYYFIDDVSVKEVTE